jgi:geranylgeranylglycerol-phosphate geranylgeranyltransferase
MATVVQRWMGRGHIIKSSYTSSERLAGLIDVTRPILTVMGALGVASAAALAYHGIPSWQLCVAGVLAAIMAYAGIHAFNDYVDSRRDIECWPGRPIPSRRLTSKQVLTLAILCFGITLLLIWRFFNPVCLIVSLISLVMGCLYSATLRDRVGYLILPPIQGTLWICGWTAFSPETLFTSWMPWVLYIFSAAWQAGHIMVYSPLHPIRKVKGQKLTQVPALFVKTSPYTAALLGWIFLVVTLVLATFLGYYFGLGWLYLIPVLIMGAALLIVAYRFVKDPENFSKGIQAFSWATYFNLTVRILILISVFIFF